MGLIELILTIVVVGVLLWLVNNYIPMDGKIKRILNVVVVILLVLFLLSLFLPLGQLSGIRVGRVKIKQVGYSDATIAPGWRYWCPGCKGVHVIPTDPRGQPNGHKWTFDGNVDAPTLQPSVHLVGQCHHFIRAGRIDYCGDSKHALAGQTVDMVDLESLTEDDW